MEENLIAEQSAERIAKYFSKISQEYKPVEEDELATDLTFRLEHENCIHPAVREEDIHHNMVKAKKTDTVLGDIPARILKEFLPELVLPITAIIREAVSSYTWPDVYKREFYLPLKKCPAPQSEDDLRGIGLTSFINKQLEHFFVKLDWALHSPTH
jgi:hypothetical protein